MAKARLLLKLLVIGGIALVLLIALALINGVISSRQAYRDEAVNSITQSYAGEQRLGGPLLILPQRLETDDVTVTDKGVRKVTPRFIDQSVFLFPKELTTTGQVKPSLRRHGLYQVPIYEFDGTLTARFEVPPSSGKERVVYGIPYLAFRVSDARGIIGRPSVQIDGVSYPVQGAPLTSVELDSPVHLDAAYGSNLRVLLPAVAGKTGTFTARMDIAVGGTQKLELVPVADANHFQLTSSWSAPLFAGQFLPRTRDISKDGFTAAWDISSLASGTQQQISSGSQSVDAISVNLANPVDAYKLSDRATKYGILFVLITFGGFFLFELLKRMQIHPIQYALVGFCLAIFFLLLISFSEHLDFGLAYLIASAACIGLLTYYLAFVLKSPVYGVAFGAMLTALYAAIYGLLISEDNALLLGSLLLFGLIAAVMIATRKIDWYAHTAEASAPPVAPTPAFYSPVPASGEQ